MKKHNINVHPHTIGAQCLSYRPFFVPEVLTTPLFFDRRSQQGLAASRAWPAPTACDELVCGSQHYMEGTTLLPDPSSTAAQQHSKLKLELEPCKIVYNPTKVALKNLALAPYAVRIGDNSHTVFTRNPA